MEKQTQTPTQPAGEHPAQSGGTAIPVLAPTDPIPPAMLEEFTDGREAGEDEEQPPGDLHQALP